jgi:hypothetical protein
MQFPGWVFSKCKNGKRRNLQGKGAVCPQVYINHVRSHQTGTLGRLFGRPACVCCLSVQKPLILTSYGGVLGFDQGRSNPSQLFHLGSFISSIENWRDSFFAPNFVSCSFRIDKEMGIALFKVPINSYLAFFQ